MSSTEEQNMNDSQGNGAGRAAQLESGATGQLDQTPGNIDKIREILFGSNMRDYDARFTRLEAVLMKESSDLRDSTRRRFEALENHVKAEMEALHARLKAEREERADASAHLAKDLNETADGLRKKIRDLDDQTTSADSAIRQEILSQSHALAEDLHSLKVEITALVEKRFRDLDHGKTDRSMLGTLLTEIGMRINDEFNLHVAGKSTTDQ